MKWHVIVAIAREDSRVLKNLQNQCFEDFVLNCRFKKYQQTSKLASEPLFPRFSSVIKGFLIS